tara:strand:+ start:142 stop:951 length:810 start_codon:yes stop_codon:yes gene_type:complete
MVEHVNINKNSMIDKYFLQDFSEQGFCVVRSVVGESIVDKLKCHLDLIVDKLISSNADIGSFINFADNDRSVVNSVHRLEELNDPFLASFIHDNGFSELASLLLDCSDPVLFSIQAFLKPAGSGLRTPPHQDNAYWCHSGNGGITLWLALDNAGPHNGMMKYTTFSNDSLVNHVPSSNTPGSSQVIEWSTLESCEWLQPTLNIGDVAVHHGLIIHFSEVNTSNNPRRGLLLNYRRPDCKRDYNRYNKYLTRLESIYGRKYSQDSIHQKG